MCFLTCFNHPKQKHKYFTYRKTKHVQKSTEVHPFYRKTKQDVCPKLCFCCHKKGHKVTKASRTPKGLIVHVGLNGGLRCVSGVQPGDPKIGDWCWEKLSPRVLFVKKTRCLFATCLLMFATYPGSTCFTLGLFTDGRLEWTPRRYTVGRIGREPLGWHLDRLGVIPGKLIIFFPAFYGNTDYSAGSPHVML